ncbi:1229_t:CDS:2, partial [Funneliformis geosporum]
SIEGMVPQITAKNVVTNVESLAYGGYVIVTKDCSTGKNDGYVVNNEGVYNVTILWGLSDKYSYVDVVVLPNNTIVVEGGDGTAPGGPGGYESAKILSTIPAKGSTVTVQNKYKNLTLHSNTLNTYNAPNVPYYVEVDNDFVKKQSNGQNVIGIRSKIWTFNGSRRLSTTKKYQYDANTKEDQFIMRVEIKKSVSSKQASSGQLII